MGWQQEALDWSPVAVAQGDKAVSLAESGSALALGSAPPMCMGSVVPGRGAWMHWDHHGAPHA